ncbi:MULTISPECIES: hypothetical protein [unclassified Rhizobium]|uniref:hypothetical protein n=1 Tax=unclassified Rhizobium TaxID=2613769 RepID=UPI0007145A94|nr:MULTISPECIES: hypothetical protein [unclassified Rhizobium]KQV39966.1 hypothetical protein ASC86_22250 [Rhizobium sp. Root1212]KRD31676.1 hypothetical protein ASE37_23295 [Rhizobium sp. Root268]
MRPIGVGVVAEDMVSEREFRKTEFFNDFFPKHIGQTAVGVTITRDQGRSVLLSTATTRSDPNENREAADRLTSLAPHHSRAFKYLQAEAKHRALTEVGGSLFGSDSYVERPG